MSWIHEGEVQQDRDSDTWVNNAPLLLGGGDMLGVAFCWRSFRSMALSIPKAAKRGGRIVGPQIIDLKHCLCVCVT
jgi:hypothetical protein